MDSPSRKTPGYQFSANSAGYFSILVRMSISVLDDKIRQNRLQIRIQRPRKPLRENFQPILSTFDFYGLGLGLAIFEPLFNDQRSLSLSLSRKFEKCSKWLDFFDLWVFD